MSEYVSCDWQVANEGTRKMIPNSAAYHADCKSGKMEKCDAWVCICGNTPHQSGFYPCTREGKEVEPTPQYWPEALYACDDCGRIIEGDTGRVVGKR